MVFWSETYVPGAGGHDDISHWMRGQMKAARSKSLFSSDEFQEPHDFMRSYWIRA